MLNYSLKSRLKFQYLKAYYRYLTYYFDIKRHNCQEGVLHPELCNKYGVFNGGADRGRTDDLLRAMQDTITNNLLILLINLLSKR